MPAAVTGGEPLERAALALEAEFREYHIGICRTRDGRALAAVRAVLADRPGTCVVITPDADEMRRALQEDSPDTG